MDKFYSVREIAKMLGVAERTIRDYWIANGQLETYKIGISHRISQTQLDKFLKSREKKGSE